ncbi:hypothetical protein NDU88_000943 [Pleurodeles waltl]|uniref:Uncharacterized protein n=1 Tax=Pleurodeles waltl TaxID=8319 RepID=A0AAV7MIB2_PLEWA|nr:hypothetical protein NDU88_000943 [Pleurodeles waltl]
MLYPGALPLVWCVGFRIQTQERSCCRCKMDLAIPLRLLGLHVESLHFYCSPNGLLELSCACLRWALSGLHNRVIPVLRRLSPQLCGTAHRPRIIFITLMPRCCGPGEERWGHPLVTGHSSRLAGSPTQDGLSMACCCFVVTAGVLRHQIGQAAVRSSAIGQTVVCFTPAYDQTHTQAGRQSLWLDMVGYPVKLGLPLLLSWDLSGVNLKHLEG